MSDTAAATVPAIESPLSPSPRSLARQSASRPGRVTGKLQIALKRIIEYGEELDQAAKAAGMTTHAVRIALDRPHVIKWMKAQREVFRAYVSAQNIHHAKQLRDTSGNAMAKLGAMKFIDAIADDPATAAQRSNAPGVVIVIAPGTASLTASQRQIDHKPLIINGAGRDDDGQADP